MKGIKVHQRYDGISSPSLWRRWMAVALVWAASGSASPAEDVVHVATPSGGRPIERRGAILDYTHRELRMTLAGGRTVAIPAEEVAKVETDWTAPHAEADLLASKRQWQAALARYQEAIRAEQRAWARREIFAEIVWCYHRLGQADAAGKVFLRIADDATARQWMTIPLAWQAAGPLVASQGQAEAWMRDDNNPAANLIGASHLLTGGDTVGATATLNRLTVNRDRRIALLAAAQLWRTSQAGLSDDELARRKAVLERLPLELRAGPYYVLGQSLAAAGRTEEAVAALFRLPVGYPQHRELAAAALAEAEQLLAQAGREDEAKIARDELAAFSETPAR